MLQLSDRNMIIFTAAREIISKIMFLIQKRDLVLGTTRTLQREYLNTENSNKEKYNAQRYY